MLGRWSGASELAAVLSALALGGCVEVLDLDRFSIGGDAGRDAGGRDGGGARDGGGDRDAGRDGCVPATYYADLDGDTYGDAASATESCAPIEGHVTNGDDCDDGNGDVRPGVTETCDDADQDCDGAVDEGLMGIIGSPIEVSRFDCCLRHDVAIVGSEAGFFLAYQNPYEYRLHVRRVAPDGTLSPDAMVEDSITGLGQRYPSAWVFRSELVAPTVALAWVETAGIRMALYPADGSAPLPAFLLTDDPDATKPRVMSDADSVIVVWASHSDDALFARRVDPLLGAPDGDVVRLPIPSPPDSITALSSMAPVGEPASELLLAFTRFSAVAEDNGVFLGRVGGTPLAWTLDLVPPTNVPTDPLGAVFLAPEPGGSARPLAVAVWEPFEEDPGACYATLDPALMSAGPSFIDPCQPFAAPPIALATRSGVAATTVLRASTRLAYLEYPLSAAGAPSPIVDIVDLTDPDGAGLAVGAYGNRALVLFEQTEGTSPSAERVLYGQRMGCEP